MTKWVRERDRLCHVLLPPGTANAPGLGLFISEVGGELHQPLGTERPKPVTNSGVGGSLVLSWWEWERLQAHQLCRGPRSEVKQRSLC